MTAVEFAARVKDAKRRGRGPWWDGRCPAHDDGRKSLSFRDGDRGLIVTCHAGCGHDAIARGAGVTVSEFFHESNGAVPSSPPPAARIAAVYDYTDAAGALRYQVVRREPKDFQQRRPDGHGGWIWNMQGVERVPYRLPELAEAPRAFAPEGERDVDALRALGLAATCNEGGAGKWRPEHTDALVAAAVPEVIVLPDNDAPGESHALAVARACLAAGLRVKILRLPGLPPKGDVSDWLSAGHTADELQALADAAPIADLDEETTATTTAAPEGELRREGLDLSMTWPTGVRLALAAIRDGREGVRGELTVTLGSRRLSWGAFNLSSTQTREALRKRLDRDAPGLPWGAYLEEACYRMTQAAREGEPIVTLTGSVTSPTRELLPRLLYEGEPTLVYGDGDTGKSLFALTIAAAVQSGAALPFGLRPARAVTAAYLDWETSRDTIEARLGLIAAGLGIDPPALIYKRMTRPLVDEAGALAAELSRRGVCLVVVDSMMFAVAGGEGAAFHEPITAFYGALRLFSPAASLVLSHVTGADARGNGPARPFGGAFAFNGPRLVWEAKRDKDQTDATAIAFTCTKANNLVRRPEPFGLSFTAGEGTITVYPLDLTEAAPQTVTGASLPFRVRIALATASMTIRELAQYLSEKEDAVGRVVRRLAGKGIVAKVGETTGQGTPAILWGLVPRGPHA